MVVSRSALAMALAGTAMLAGEAQARQAVPHAPSGVRTAPVAGQTAAPEMPTVDPQATPGTEGRPEPAGRDIVVTGSRISRRDLTSQTPIVTLGQDAIASRGAPTVEQTLNQLPQFTAAAGSASSFNARGGQANVNLRALGAQRTLVLVDGRRLQPANPDGSTDLNVIPAALVDSIETITGGASAVYGSDAIAGVVNVKLKRFHGVELDGQAGVTDKGDGATRDLALTAGADFAGGRGNLTIAGDYSSRDAVSFTQRSYLEQQALSTNTPNGTLLVNAASLPSQAAVNAIFARYGAAPGSVSRSTAFSFNADGSVFRPQNTLLGYNGPTDGIYSILNGSLYGNTGFFNLAQIPLERFTGYGRAEFRATDAVRLFVQGLYTHYTSDTLGPPPNSSSTLNMLSVPVANPFIPADLRALLASRANPAAAFTIQKRFDVLGPRTEHDRYDVYQITAGADGRLGIGDLKFDVYGTVGRTLYAADEINYPSVGAVQRLLSAPDGGASICAGGFNPFGPQPVSAACAAYLGRFAESRTSLRQAVVEGTVTGSIVALPAGKLSFALGADYRRTSYAFAPDPGITAGDLANILPVSASSGAQNAKEVYGELLVPVLADTPLFRSLNVDLGYRYSNYNISGGVSTYKADLDWTPFSPVTFRSGYSRAIRAPSVGDLFTAATLDSVSLGTLGPVGSGDPCDVRSGYRAAGYAGAAQVRALCLAQGVPPNLIDSYLNTLSRAPTTTAGNLALRPETADTYSIGAVFNTRFAGALLHRFTLSVDYYDIKVRDAIGTITAPLAVSKCFNADGSNPGYDPANIFCKLLSRSPGSGVIGNVNTQRLNLGGYRTSGVDVAANLPVGLADLGVAKGSGTVTLSGDVSYLRSFRIQTLPGSPFFDYAGTIQNTQIDLFSSARPRWKSTSSVRYSDGAFDLGFRWRYIGPMNNAANVGVATPTLPVTPAVSYFDLDAAIRVGTRFELRGGITNLLDRQPPITNPSPLGNYTIDLNTYDLIGRRFFISVKARL